MITRNSSQKFPGFLTERNFSRHFQNISVKKSMLKPPYSACFKIKILSGGVLSCPVRHGKPGELCGLFLQPSEEIINLIRPPRTSYNTSLKLHDHILAGN